MGFSPKTLVAFCFTVLFIISFVHCLPMTPVGSPGNGRKQIPRPEWRCYEDDGCRKGQVAGCDRYCKGIRITYGICIGLRCCCFEVTPIPPPT
ncbi:hypothetical protein ISN45_Aa03g039700 [Arabidopsis thaliana x Arabidopsis arenosa]|uniref:Uncharacterized protein n=1 Tax=Arabidopsis thaliana x Arabidopsis arenosa TaxID=1240361 RepID=A0A8T2B4F2_9BRAS|nr:hypothetical protein ISN45_Aa03g039700 [Arabidopsis thaliana x Arabidopsis arenosa]